jgi:hypothetical protein
MTSFQMITMRINATKVLTHGIHRPSRVPLIR